MNKLLLLALSLLWGVSGQSQVVLTYKIHGLLAGTENRMQLTSYVDPGETGVNTRWDFSEVKNTGTFSGSLTSLSLSRAGALFSAGNTTLEEFGNLFVFNTTEEKLEQWGYLSGQGGTRIQYTKPFVKMKFPFSFGREFSGDFSAEYIAGDKVVGSMVGTYSVAGDGLGTLILPDGKEHVNVLRVKEVKKYETNMNGQRFYYVDESIRWYSQDSRYPLMVLIKSSVSGLNGSKSVPTVSTRAAYSTVIPAERGSLFMEGVKLAPSIKVFPNPFRGQATIAVNLSDVTSLTIDVFDVSGRLVKQLVSATLPAGDHSFIFSNDEKESNEGAYIIRVNSNGQLSTYRVVELK